MEVTENTIVTADGTEQPTTETVTTETTQQDTPESTEQQQESGYEQSQIDNRLQVEKDLKQDLENKGVSWDNITNEFEQMGDLSPHTREALEKAGYPKSVVDNYINGLKAEQTAFVSAVYNSVGGEEEFRKIADFVSNQSQKDIQAFNDVVSTANLHTIKLVLNGLKAQMTGTYGTANRTILGNEGTQGNTISGYEERHEMVSAMSDPRYGKDTKYTKEVEQRVKLSNFF